MSPTTSLLLIWPQTWSYSWKNIMRACPSHVFPKSISSAWTVLAPLPCWQPPLRGNVFVLTPLPRDHNCTRTWKNFSTYIRCFKKISMIFCFPVFLPLSIFAKPVLVMPVGFKRGRLLFWKQLFLLQDCLHFGCDLPPGRWGSALSLHPGYPGSTELTQGQNLALWARGWAFALF